MSRLRGDLLLLRAIAFEGKDATPVWRFRSNQDHPSKFQYLEGLPTGAPHLQDIVSAFFSKTLTLEGKITNAMSDYFLLKIAEQSEASRQKSKVEIFWCEASLRVFSFAARSHF
jgi:hypothetical protein